MDSSSSTRRRKRREVLSTALEASLEATESLTAAQLRNQLKPRRMSDTSPSYRDDDERANIPETKRPSLPSEEKYRVPSSSITLMESLSQSLRARRNDEATGESLLQRCGGSSNPKLLHKSSSMPQEPYHQRFQTHDGETQSSRRMHRRSGCSSSRSVSPKRSTKNYNRRGLFRAKSLDRDQHQTHQPQSERRAGRNLFRRGNKSSPSDTSSYVRMEPTRSGDVPLKILTTTTGPNNTAPGDHIIREEIATTELTATPYRRLSGGLGNKTTRTKAILNESLRLTPPRSQELRLLGLGSMRPVDDASSLSLSTSPFRKKFRRRRSNDDRGGPPSCRRSLLTRRNSSQLSLKSNGTISTSACSDVDAQEEMQMPQNVIAVGVSARPSNTNGVTISPWSRLDWTVLHHILACLSCVACMVSQLTRKVWIQVKLHGEIGLVRSSDWLQMMYRDPNVQRYALHLLDIVLYAAGKILNVLIWLLTTLLHIFQYGGHWLVNQVLFQKMIIFFCGGRKHHTDKEAKMVLVADESDVAPSREGSKMKKRFNWKRKTKLQKRNKEY